MEIKEMKKKGGLFLFHIDHLSGEEIGYLIDKLYEWGAKNVNVISTLTKKNRPGHLILVDFNAIQPIDLPRRMAGMFGVSGYHLIDTIHHYMNVENETQSLAVRRPGHSVKEKIDIKVVGKQTESLSKRAEYDDLIRIFRQLDKTDPDMYSPANIKRQVQGQLNSARPLLIDLEN